MKTPATQPVSGVTRKRGIIFAMAALLILLCLIMIGLLALRLDLHPDAMRAWLNRHNGLWLLWRMALYAVVIFGVAPRLARKALKETSEVNDSAIAVARLQWRLMALAAMLEWLVMQHGLAQLTEALT